MTLKKRALITSAMDEQEVGWPLPAAEVDSTEWIRSLVAMSFRTWASSALTGILTFGMGLQRTGGALKSCMTRLQDYQTNKLLLCNVSGFKEAATLSEMDVGTH